MKGDRWLNTVLSGLVLLATCACRAPYSNPPEGFEDGDLVGTWETHYPDRDVDQLILKADGTFKQVYRDWIPEKYVYETPWNKWWVERFPDGRARLHLQGARYYLDGIETAELEGLRAPCPTEYPDCWGAPEPPPAEFYDPIAKESVRMVKELMLNVRSDSDKTILMHMWTGSDRGFAIIGGRTEEFRRVEEP